MKDILYYMEKYKDCTPVICLTLCPFCKKEIIAGTDCEHCKAKYVGNDGGNYCEFCESTYYYYLEEQP